MLLPAIYVNLPFTTEVLPLDSRPTLVIAISSLRHYFFFTSYPYFLALISSSPPTILILSFHLRSLYYTRAITEDKKVTALCSIHEVGYSACSLLSSSTSFVFSRFFLPFSSYLTSQYNTVCIFHYLYKLLIFSASFTRLFFWGGHSIRRMHCTFLSKSFSIPLITMYNIKDEGFLTQYME